MFNDSIKIIMNQDLNERFEISTTNSAIYQLTDRNFVDNFLQVVIYLALVANI